VQERCNLLKALIFSLNESSKSPSSDSVVGLSDRPCKSVNTYLGRAPNLPFWGPIRRSLSFLSRPQPRYLLPVFLELHQWPFSGMTLVVLVLSPIYSLRPARLPVRTDKLPCTPIITLCSIGEPTGSDELSCSSLQLHIKLQVFRKPIVSTRCLLLAWFLLRS
jgi:hypothetical protein